MGVRITAWVLLLKAVLVILSGRQILRDLERFATRQHYLLTEALCRELRGTPYDSVIRYFR